MEIMLISFIEILIGDNTNKGERAENILRRAGELIKSPAFTQHIINVFYVLLLNANVSSIIYSFS